MRRIRESSRPKTEHRSRNKYFPFHSCCVVFEELRACMPHPHACRQQPGAWELQMPAVFLTSATDHHRRQTDPENAAKLLASKTRVLQFNFVRISPHLSSPLYTYTMLGVFAKIRGISSFVLTAGRQVQNVDK